MSVSHAFLQMLGVLCLSLSSAYALLAVAGLIAWRVRQAAQKLPSVRPPVTVLKPLCGSEPGLYANLRSFCVQEYPQYQLVFGVRDAADPALGVVRRLQAEFPHLCIDVVINARQHGTNRKVSNLINILELARHDLLAIADSDVAVGPDYLTRVIAPLLDPRVGLVTCLYHGIPTDLIWSRLGAMYVNHWYMPSVLLAKLFGENGFASGQTLCLRRDTLEAFGGLRAIANHLADDYQLGALVRGVGQRILLSPYVVTGEHHEPTLDALIRHETRWMRTIRVLRPASFRFLFISFSMPLACVGLALVSAAGPLPGIAPRAAPSTLPTLALALFWTTVVARVMLAWLGPLTRARAVVRDLWLLPVRDLLLCWVWARALCTSRVSWRGGDFEVDAQGLMRSPP